MGELKGYVRQVAPMAYVKAQEVSANYSTNEEDQWPKQ
jgi:hypothetical protein